MADNEEEAPKKGVDIAKLRGGGSTPEHLREQMERMGILKGGSASERLRKEIDLLDTLTGRSRALQNALTPSTAIQKSMEVHNAAFNMARALPDVSSLTGIAEASRLFEMQKIRNLFDPVGGSAFKEFHDKVYASLRLGPIANMVFEQSALANVALNLGVIQSESVNRMLESVRAGQSTLRSAISAYTDQHREQAQRLSSVISALAIPRIDPAMFGIGSALALSETNAFNIVGLTPDYTEQFRSIAGAVNEQLSSFNELRTAHKAFMLQPDLVGGISDLLERVLAQQEALLEQQLQPLADTQPRQQTLIAEKLTIISAIITILWTILSAYVMLEEHLAGGDAATLANAAAIEENTQTLEQMRGSFDSLADQLEKIRLTQEEANGNERAADAAIAEILREIANKLTEQKGGQEDAPDRPSSDGPP